MTRLSQAMSKCKPAQTRIDVVLTFRFAVMRCFPASLPAKPMVRLLSEGATKLCPRCDKVLSCRIKGLKVRCGRSDSQSSFPASVAALRAARVTR